MRPLVSTVPAISMALLHSLGGAAVSAFSPPRLSETPSRPNVSGSLVGSRSLSNSDKVVGSSSTTTLYNFLDDVGNLLSGPNLESETNLPYDPPLSSDMSISDNVRTFAIKERPLSFTGEDFDIVEITSGNEEDLVRVRGAMLHLPGKDKMRVSSCATGEKCVVMDRVLIAATPSYDLYRTSDGVKIGWMEKKLISFMDTFDVYMEGKGGFGVTGLFKPDPAYRIEGDFLDRNFSFKNQEGKVVARANMDCWVQLDMMNHYQVQVADGMDAMLVLACVCCIDEEFDEEHQKRREGS